MTDHHKAFPPIQFEALARALLANINSLVASWLPGGVVRGHEYVCGSLSGGRGSSTSVNLTNGRWADFADDAQGNDLISLYAAIHGLGMAKAAVEVARAEGLEDVADVQPARSGAPAVVRAPRPEPVAVAATPRQDEGWVTVLPVPDNAPPPTFKHAYRLAGDITHTAVYKCDGAMLGYVVRFRTNDGGKDTLPYTWCTSARDGGSRWHWKTWDEPRPLFLPGGVSAAAMATPVTVVVVEGERKAEVLQALLDATAPRVYLVASWPGGSKGWKKADWRGLCNSTILLWPDCDGKRVPLTKAERTACLDDVALAVAQASKPLLPVDKQPGMAAMLGIGVLLRDTQSCTVSMLQIPAPLEVVDGWDCADAIENDGWDGERVLAFFGRAQALVTAQADSASLDDSGKPVARLAVVLDDDFTRASAIAAGAGADGEDDAFVDHLMFMVDSLKLKGVHEIGVNRKLLITALRKAPALQACLGFNELTGSPGTRVPWPFRAVAGPLKDTDDLALGDYLCGKYKGLRPASRASLSEAIETVADQNRYHPVRDWLHAQAHNGTPRLDKWLIYVLGMDPATLAPRRKRYLELVGRYLLIGLVARVMDPGCKFDYSPVFEGLPGVGKSTFVKTLVGAEFFSDTHFDIGNGKDGFEQLEGLWGYELSELTALRKADSEQVKQFFSSTVDRFRGAYGKYVQAHPRQCVIFCSTNKKQYLYDLTGNRRFWPIWIDQQIKLAWLQRQRGQLFAEALAAYLAGEVYAPSREDETTYFEPEQKLRLVETAVQSRLYELLTREGAPSGEGKLTSDLNQLVTFVTLDRLVSALGADAAKSSSLLESQIRGWLEAHGWSYGRESTGQRRRGYKQPDAWPPKIDDDEGAAAPRTPANAAGREEGADDEPF